MIKKKRNSIDEYLTLRLLWFNENSYQYQTKRMGCICDFMIYTLHEKEKNKKIFYLTEFYIELKKNFDEYIYNKFLELDKDVEKIRNSDFYWILKKVANKEEEYRVTYLAKMNGGNVPPGSSVLFHRMNGLFINLKDVKDRKVKANYYCTQISLNKKGKKLYNRLWIKDYVPASKKERYVLQNIKAYKGVIHN